MAFTDDAGITVAGTTYVPATTMSLARYGYLMSAVWALELDGLPSDAALMTRVFERGLGGEFLAGFLVPMQDGMPLPWSGERAAEIGKAFDNVSDPDAMNQLLLLLVRLLVGFFRGVVGSLASSATSSASTAMTPVSTSEAPMSAPRAETPSASSDSSSAPSPDTTSTSTPESSDGTSEKG